MGYHRAGFEVVGVDIAPQPHYPFEFHQGDAMTFPLDGFDAIHASPPCQAYSSAGHAALATYGYTYPDLYQAVRARIITAGVPWVIENVTAAPSRSGIVLCGSMFGRGDLQRHRLFESSMLILLDRHCRHDKDVITVTGHTPQRWLGGRRKGVSPPERNAAMGIDWMTVAELTQAIPPVYTQFIGAHLLEEISAIPLDGDTRHTR
jgi:DNA (cytosine-5)-methyltransferase 1